MKRNTIIITALLLAVLPFLNKQGLAWNARETHRLLSGYAADNSVLNKSKEDYLKAIGFDNGLDEFLKWDKTQRVRDWIKDGAEFEDNFDFLSLVLYGQGRFSNHFHNPLKSWETAGLDDWIKFYHLTGESSLLWAQDREKQAYFTEGDWTWQRTRESYYLALISEQKTLKEGYFAKTFRGLGHQMHLIQDCAVPYHVRNDAHLEDTFEWKNAVGTSLFETWTKDNSTKIEPFASDPDMPAVPFDISHNGLAPISQLIDTDQYNGTNPTVDLTQGLAEYTNANFFSEDTIFAAERFSEGDRHYFPYPKASSTDIQNYINKLPETVIAEDGVADPNIYIAKTGDGEQITHFVKPTYLSRDIYIDVGDGELFERTFYLDKECHKDYTEKLIPRAVGYSAALLDYFFRGSIEISLPEKGTYAFTEDAGQGSFSSITLLAQNTSPDGEEMTDGSIELVVKFKLALNNPLTNENQPVPTTDEFSYIVAPEVNNSRSIPRNSPSEFTFDLTNNPLPFWATDVYLQVVYKGQLGSEAEAIAIGFKDISEPTPVDIFNNMDKICLYDNWYDAGSTEAIDLVDANNNGIADTNEWDVYSHDLENIFFTFLPSDDQHYPSCTEDDIYIQNLSGGDYHRMFILSDYAYCYSFCAVSVIHTHPDDNWGATYFPPSISCTNGIKNQTELVDSEACLSFGVNPPCYIRYYPTFTTIRGIDNWTGINYRNSAFPEDSSCPIESLN